MRQTMEELDHIKKDFPSGSFSESELTHLSASLAYCLRKEFPSEAGQFKSIYDTLERFYRKFDPLPLILSGKYINSTISEIAQIPWHEPKSKPQITYILPVYGVQKNKLVESLISLSSQVGVSVTALLIIDGPEKNDHSKVSEALSMLKDKLNTIILTRSQNGGVAKARNSGMKMINTPFFSWLDPHDVIHPLRSIHAIAYINNKKIDRLNTSYSRVALEANKLYLRNWEKSHCGHTSFVSRTHLINQFGYLMDLKSHEDTEYQQRLEYFKADMHNTSLVGHYLDFTIDNKNSHLSRDTWSTEEAIESHSVLGGSYEGSITDERRRHNARAFNIYQQSMREISEKYFPCIE